MNNDYYFVRHGQSESNKGKYYNGTQDAPLTKRGVEQALALRESLKSKEFDLIYSSPLSRAFHTAIISLGKAVPIFNQNESYMLKFLTSEESLIIIIDSRLCERNLGDLEGVSYDEAEQISKYKDRKPAKSFIDQADGGENFRDVEKRLIPFLEKLHTNLSGKKILIFTHNGHLRLIKRYFENLSEEETIIAHTNNCELIHYKR